MLDPFFTAEGLMSLLTLTALEIVLGLDNIVFISILSGDLPKEQQPKARQLGLGFALLTRLLLLFTISWFMGLTAPLFSVMGLEITGRSIILLLGGAFLVGKSSYEIYEKVEGHPEGSSPSSRASSMTMMIVQIALIDIVFSIDSVVTAVGMAEHLSIMVVAMVVAMIIMVVFSGPVSDYVNEHPSMKVLALAFLMLVGVLLVAEGLGQHVNKGTIYFAMAFALAVELVNIRAKKLGAKTTP
jgi:predicted tellurium resistance membrane protein TerC